MGEEGSWGGGEGREGEKQQSKVSLEASKDENELNGIFSSKIIIFISKIPFIILIIDIGLLFWCYLCKLGPTTTTS